jgi:hypothetical protein
MIEESLLKSNFAGKDGFIWWIGQVADPSVWRNEKTRLTNSSGEANQSGWAYRCKVRIVGYHSFSRNELPDADLPWAHVLTSAADGAPGQGGFGKTPMLVGGESVVGFFLDGDEAQQPVVMGCFHRTPATVNIDNPNPFDPFTGFKGPFRSGAQATRQKQQPPAPLNTPPTSFGSGPQVTMFSNPSFGTAEPGSLDLSAGFVPLSTNQSSNAGANYGLSGIGTANPDTLFYKDKGELTFLNAFDKQPPAKGDNGCSNNIIDQITATLQNFIKFVNSLEATAYGFIDPLRNKVVDMRKAVRKVARLIASVVKFIINGVRDNLFNLVGCLFKILGITLPSSIKLPVSEATKNILNIIFCLFEKLFGPLLDFIMGLLNGLIGRSPNIPRCAAEETIATLIAKLADMIDGALGTVVSGLDWLADGLGSIAGAIRQGLNFISQILSFLSCDALACQNVTSWDPFAGITLPNSDEWRRTLDNIDILGGLDDEIDVALGFLSMFGSSDTPFRDCRQTIVNPQTQTDAPRTPIGVTYPRCIPPEIIINGDGIGAAGQAVVSTLDGSILTIQITNRGRGYTTAPSITIQDNTRYGTGAVARSTINSSGELESIYLVQRGSGYCQTNLNNLVGVGSTAGIGIGTTVPDPNRRVPGISTTAVGIVTAIAIDSPGTGYTSGDTISVGGCIYIPIVSSNGSIVAIEGINCTEEFTEYPDVVINTTQGEGAILYPVISYVPQFVIDSPNISARVGIGTTIVSVVQCV